MPIARERHSGWGYPVRRKNSTGYQDATIVPSWDHGIGADGPGSSMAMTIELNLEQERIVQEALRQGLFHSVEEALDQAIQSIAPRETPLQPRKTAAGKKSLVEVFAPLRGLDLDFSRNPSTGRPVEP